ncbi:MAG: tRNA (guanosine(37)-N1)-methyltransferase TrmD, partial [Clostridia bacterium]|nr:tRNA (guanosine(37)-N1)-methyltransferase TrmD [Clostridia bacterium]
EVPEVLLSGDHGKVDRWRLEQAVARTLERRPDMLEAADAAGELTKEEREILDTLKDV